MLVVTGVVAATAFVHRSAAPVPRHVAGVVEANFEGPARQGLANAGERPWAVAGLWGVEGGEVRLLEEPPGAPALATVDLERGAVAVAATLGEAVDGAGLVFGLAGPDDWWAVLAQPSLGGYRVVRSTAVGGIEPVTTIPLAPTAPGTEVAVAVYDGQAYVLVDRTPRAVVPRLEGAGTSAGLVGLPGSAGATWRSLLALPIELATDGLLGGDLLAPAGAP